MDGHGIFIDGSRVHNGHEEGTEELKNAMLVFFPMLPGQPPGWATVASALLSLQHTELQRAEQRSGGGSVAVDICYPASQVLRVDQRPRLGSLVDPRLDTRLDTRLEVRVQLPPYAMAVPHCAFSAGPMHHAPVNYDYMYARSLAH